MAAIPTSGMAERVQLSINPKRESPMQRLGWWAMIGGIAATLYLPSISLAGFAIEDVLSRPVKAVANQDSNCFVRLVLDDQDRPHVVFKTPGASIYYATRNAMGWQVERIDSTTGINQQGGFGFYCSIALGPDDVPAVAYFDDLSSGAAAHRLMYKRRGPPDVNGNWPTREVVFPGEIPVNSPTSLAVDAQSRVHLAYATNQGFYYVRREQGTWSDTTRVAVSSSTHPSLAIDETGEPMVAYNYNRAVWMATRSGGNWISHPAIDPSSSLTNVSPSLAMGPDGEPRVAFLIQGGWLGFGARSVDSWSWSKQAGDDGRAPCIAFGPPGIATILHLSGGHLVLTKTCWPSWTNEVVSQDEIGGTPKGDDYSLAIDSEGRAHIVYQIPGDRLQIRYAVQTGVVGVPQTTPRARPVGLSISPNPVRAGAEFSIKLERSAGTRVRIQVLDVQQRRILSRELALNAAGETVVPLTIPGARAGVYFVRVDGDGMHASGRLVLLR